MQWTLEGAHLLLQTRAHVLDDGLDSAFRDWYPKFRPDPTNHPVCFHLSTGFLVLSEEAAAALIELFRLRNIMHSPNILRHDWEFKLLNQGHGQRREV